MLVKLALMFSFQDGEHFTLPYHVLLDRTRKVRDELLSHRQRLTGSTMSVQPPGGATGSAAGSSVTPAGPSQQQQNDQEIFVSLLAIDICLHINRVRPHYLEITAYDKPH